MANRDLKSIHTWVFDLDNTLYDARCNLFHQIDIRMRGFIEDFLGLGPDEAFRIQKTYFREYGTTLRGLMDRHGLEPERFLDHVHDIDLGVVEPNPALDRHLDTLPGRKVIFTNASAGHAERVTKKLGINRHFEGCLDIVGTGYLPKPQARTYDILIDRFGIEPEGAVMVEDMARNLSPAKALGMTTLWVRTDSDFGREGSGGDYIDHVTDDLTAWFGELLSSDV
ncbi:MAG: pyrimidine 5'-nucleotidase [Magnetovibrionaceae bacterium]